MNKMHSCSLNVMKILVIYLQFQKRLLKKLHRRFQIGLMANYFKIPSRVSFLLNLRIWLRKSKFIQYLMRILLEFNYLLELFRDNATLVSINFML